MKTVLFHSNQLGIRGTEVALYDYALYNETLLGNKSYILSNSNSDLSALKKFTNKFEVFLYKDFKECNEFALRKNATHAYFIKAGDNDNKIISNVFNSIHAVFQHKEIHGDSYAYVSEWLANQMNMSGHYVPHVVWLPQPTLNYRKDLNIPETNIVVGRYGGLNDFDLPFVWNAVYEVALKRKDITFLFMNTAPFCPSVSNIIHVNSTYNLQNKSNFINTCDYMIHARHHGESFGLSIGEFLFHNKPVITWGNGLDKNHLVMLKDKGIFYDDFNHLNDILFNVTKFVDVNCASLVESFSPVNVMDRFNKIFLK